MDYSSLKTSTLENRLAGAAAGSAEHRALQEELHRRGAGQSRRPDKETGILFGNEAWRNVKRWRNR